MFGSLETTVEGINISLGEVFIPFKSINFYLFLFNVRQVVFKNSNGLKYFR